MVSFLSDGGRRTQVLDPLSTDELLSVETASCWGGDLYSLPDRSKFYLGLDLDPEQVESLEVVLREGGSNTELARFPMTAAAGFPTGPFGNAIPFTPPTWMAGGTGRVSIPLLVPALSPDWEKPPTLLSPVSSSPPEVVSSAHTS